MDDIKQTFSQQWPNQNKRKTVVPHITHLMCSLLS